jgi:hypothetical protein
MAMLRPVANVSKKVSVEMTNTPEGEKTTHSATDSDKCYEMKRRYGWDLLRIDKFPDEPIFKVNCVFLGEAKFPKHWTEDEDDD